MEGGQEGRELGVRRDRPGYGQAVLGEGCQGMVRENRQRWVRGRHNKAHDCAGAAWGLGLGL